MTPAKQTTQVVCSERLLQQLRWSLEIENTVPQTSPQGLLLAQRIIYQIPNIHFRFVVFRLSSSNDFLPSLAYRSRVMCAKLPQIINMRLHIAHQDFLGTPNLASRIEDVFHKMQISAQNFKMYSMHYSFNLIT